MLVGHDEKRKIFEELAKSDVLSHGYIFFGEEQVGKKTFALSFANFLEKGRFETPEGILSEAKLISPEEGSIGIDTVKEAKHFLSQKPISSKRRVLIVNDAHKLTSQAQNAILKISEEPPQSSLIIVISPTLDSLLSTLTSRLQRVYFSRIETKEIAKLMKDNGVTALEAEKIAQSALGRPGRAMDALQDPEFKRFSKLVKEFIKDRLARKDILQSLIKENDDVPDRDLIDIFVSHIMAELALDPMKNEKVLSALCDRFSKMNDFTTNRRLQLETALWNL
ncbi:MAG: DNA polymerase III subunit [Candidatus Colwellbacteria bacterium]|nr:DNA polymerase III subunit [Candidatus Colwellbacteria bacterium]